MRVIYPGSFHPPTLGHINIIRRAASMFDEVLVAVMMNPEKTYLFSPERRVDMLERCLSDLENVRVVADGGLLAELCIREKADAILRSLRSSADYEYEWPLALANHAIGAPETIYIQAEPSLMHISSTIASDIARHGGDLKGFIPAELIEEVRDAFHK